MNKPFLCVGIVFISICLSSCSFHRRVAGKKAKSIDSTAVRAVTDTSRTAAAPTHDTLAAPANDSLAAEKQLIAELTPIWNNRIDYKTFSGKARIHFAGPDDNKEFTAHFRIRKDSVIWVNVTFAGIAVARLFITRDSFFLLNPTQKEITMLPLSQAAKVLPTKVDFSSLQNLVTGEPLRDGKMTGASSAPFGGSWTIQVEDSAYVQRFTYSKTDSTIRTGQMRTRKPGGPQAITAYGDYETVNNHKISTSRTLNIQNGMDVYSLDMNFTKVDFDEPLDYPFNVPKSYTVKVPATSPGK